MKLRNVLLIMLCIFFTGNMFGGATNTWEGKGRIALSSDGNEHDHDDINATKMALMILAKEGLQEKVVLYTYADHIWGSNQTTSDQLDRMHTVALGAKEKFGFHDASFMAAVEDPAAAYAAMATAIEASTAENPLFIIGAGPMHVIGEGLRIANGNTPDALNHVTVISHSNWNNNHGQSHKDPETTDHDGWTWDMMKSSFGTKVNFKKISDQNATPDANGNTYTNNDKFKASTMTPWAWMNTHQDPNVKWVYENHTGKGSNSAADYSDAGMSFYLVTGDEMGNPVKLQNYIGTDVIAVTPPDPLKVSRVNLNVSEYHIKTLNGTYQLEASVLPETATNKAVSWSSSNTAIATVSPTGLVTGHKLGYATITVNTVDGNKSAKCNFQVGVVEAADYEVGDDYICFEAEWTKSPLQKWVLRQAGYSDYVNASSGVNPINNTYLEYTGGTEDGNASGQDILVYKFKPKTSGKYWLTGRMAQNQNGAAWDKCNDIYVKMEGNFTSGNTTPLNILTSWTKLYGRGLEDWGAFVQMDVNHTKYKAAYNLEAGVEYTLSVSGRATRTCIDYYLFYKDGAAVQVAEKLDLATHAPEYMRPGSAGPTCMTIEAHDFTNTNVTGYDPAAKVTIPGSPADGINKGEPVIGCINSNGKTRPIAAEITYSGIDADVSFSVKAVGEPDGECTYEVFVNGTKVGEKQSTMIFGTGVAPYTYEDLLINTTPVALTKGDVIRVTSNQVSNDSVPEGDGFATARGRWVSIDICGEGVVPPPTEKVEFNSLPSAFSTSQLVLPLKVKYTANEARDIYVSLKTSTDVLVKDTTISVTTGSATKSIDFKLNEAAVAASGYKFHTALRTTSGDETTNIATDNQVKNFIDGPVLPTKDEVSYIDLPKSFPNNTLSFPIKIHYAATQNRIINLAINGTDNKYMTNKAIEVEGGEGDTTITITVASNLTIANGYKFLLAIRPLGGTWRDNIDDDNQLFDITDGGAIKPTDIINYKVTPTSFTNNTTSLSVDVTYETSLQRDFSLELKDSEFNHIGDTAITMDPGKGETTITLDLETPLAIANGYQFILTIRLVGQDWTTNITRQDATFNIIDGGSTSINTFKNNINLFPNPTSGLVNFNNSGNISSVKVMNLQGQALLEQNIENGINSLSLEQFNNGMYIIQFNLKNASRFTKRVLKQ
ncbi:Ig-like domain-containing protein [Bacteroidales bacterium]|nr:Ig-like domain-containing protein [Bacteroidales bacterium]